MKKIVSALVVLGMAISLLMVPAIAVGESAEDIVSASAVVEETVEGSTRYLILINPYYPQYYKYCFVYAIYDENSIVIQNEFYIHSFLVGNDKPGTLCTNSILSYPPFPWHCNQVKP